MSTNWLLVFFSLIFSAFFSGMEIAFVSSSRLKQELDIKNRLISAKVLSGFFENPSRFIGALLFGNNVALVIYGTAMANILEPVLEKVLPQYFKGEVWVLIAQTIIATLLILVVAEFIPKALFRIRPNAWLKTFAIPVWIFYYLFYPLIFIYIGFSEFILHFFTGDKGKKTGYTFSAVDLDEYIQNLSTDEEPGQLLNQELVMIQNAMDFKNVRLRDCMIPRTEIIAIEINKSPLTLRNLFTETGHSKIMIYKENIDNIIGYVHAYDMFKKPETILEVLRKADVYPETTPANTVLKQLLKNHKSVAIVVDEFGGTSGMVTMEDIMEEIFGEIEDEYDKDEEIEQKISENEYIFSTRMEIDYINEKYKLNIPESEEYETLAGFILHHYSSIPKENSEIEIPPYKFFILKATDNKLEKVKLIIE